MAEACLPTSSSSASSSFTTSPSTLTPKEKPVVVRVKRKASQTPLDALWLEISERPPKKALLDLDKLSFSDSPSNEKEKSVTRKILVQHVETICSSEGMKDLLESCLVESTDSREFNRKFEERKHAIKPDRRQEQLRTTARQKHEILVKSARFEQIWKSRRSEGGRQDDFIREICHLYDVVRVDDEKVHEKMEEEEDASVEDNAILCNYLPLLREYLPTAAAEIESDMVTSASTQDGYVYDIYTLENDTTANAVDLAQYPLVQVNGDDDFYVDQSESDCDTDDSNAENNPLNDYPDEETSEDEAENGFLSEVSEEYEKEIVYTSEEEAKDWRWSYR